MDVTTPDDILENDPDNPSFSEVGHKDSGGGGEVTII